MARLDLLLLRAFLLLYVVALHGSSCTQEDLWKTLLPKVSMPAAIRENLLCSSANDKSLITLSTKENAKTTQPFTTQKGITTQPSDVKETKAILTNPATVYSWQYKADDKKNVGVKETKATLTNPATVYAWQYKVDNEKKVDVKETKATLTNPATVYAWKYKADNEEKVDVKEIKDTLTNPATVYAWQYKADNEKKVDVKETKTILTNPLTVYAWQYKADNEKKVDVKETKATLTNTATVYAWQYKTDDKEKKVDVKETKATLTNPATVYAWQYKADYEKKVDVKETKATLTNPATVYAWQYKADNEKKVDVKETKATLTNPATVYAWQYKADNKKKVITTQPFIGGRRFNGHGAKHYNDFSTSYVNNEDHSLSIDKKMDHKDIAIAGSSFFMEKDLRLGAKLTHDFQKSDNVPFLPSDMAKSIPFSVDKLPEILNRLSINPESIEATNMKETLSLCLERPRVKKENRTCAPSLEAMVKFVVQELGTNDIKVTMMSNLDKVPTGINEYEVKWLRKMPTLGKVMVTCHRMSYPYAVYYCHHQKEIGEYAVTIADPKGVTVETSALCHYDTYAWQPDVPALRYLKIRPGDSPVCHFAGTADIFWASKTITSNMGSFAKAE